MNSRDAERVRQCLQHIRETGSQAVDGALFDLMRQVREVDSTVRVLTVSSSGSVPGASIGLLVEGVRVLVTYSMSMSVRFGCGTQTGLVKDR